MSSLNFRRPLFVQRKMEHGSCKSRNPFRQHTPDDDPEQGTPGTGQDVCPECEGTGKQFDKATGKSTVKSCERCDGTGKVIQGIGERRLVIRGKGLYQADRLAGTTEDYRFLATAYSIRLVSPSRPAFSGRMRPLVTSSSLTMNAADPTGCRRSRPSTDERRRCRQLCRL